MSAPAEVHPVGERASARILTVPNLVTAVRLALLPVFAWLLLAQDERYAAAWLLAALGATDWVDGFLARRLGQVSELGKVLDPTADRLVFIVGITAMLIDGSAPVAFSVLVITRELVLGGTLVVLTLFGMRRFDVTWWGKAGTFGLLMAFPLFLCGASDAFWADQGRIAGWVVGVPGLVLSYVAAAAYVPAIRRNWRAGRAERSARASNTNPSVQGEGGMG